MSDPFLGEIRMFAGNFAPVGWNFCDGTVLPISQNDALFTLLGTTYGGDGQVTFALPDLRGRLPLHPGPNVALGQAGGAETVALTVPEMAAHPHVMMASLNAANLTDPTQNLLAQLTAEQLLYRDGPGPPMAAQSVGTTGLGYAHNNLQPYLCVNFIIALAGVYPPQQ